MKEMIFKVRPYIHTDDRRFDTMLSEIYTMPLSMIDEGINSCQLVLNGEYEELNWGLEVFELSIKKDLAILEYHGEYVSELTTTHLLKLLKDYKDALVFLEKKG